MKRFFQNAVVGLVVMLSLVGASNTLAPTTAHAAACSDSGTFFGLPHWWRGLGKTETNEVTNQTSCSIILTQKDGKWQTGLMVIAVNVIDILLRLIGLIAVLFIIMGGIRYIISQGNSGDLTTAKTTIVRAVGGLVIAIAAVFILNFIAGNIFNLTVNKDTYKVSLVEKYIV